jgi:hypothetical protein
MKQIQGLLFIFLFVFIIPPVHAQSSAGKVDQLLKLSGIDKRVGEMSGLVLMGFQQAAKEDNLKNIDQKAIDAISSGILKAFDGKALRATLAREVAAGLTDQDIDQLLTWYSSDTGRTITSEEEQAATPDAYMKMMQNAETLLKDEASVSFAKKFDQKFGVSEWNLRMVENAGKASYIAAHMASSPGLAVDLRSYNNYIQAKRPALIQSIKRDILLSFAYSYRNVSDPDLASYMRFMDTPEAVKFTKTYMKALESAFDQALGKLSDEITSALAKGTDL